MFHDPLDTLALKGLSSATHAQPALEYKLQKWASPAKNLKSARTVMLTNFYADELIRGEPQIENWKMNCDTRVWVRPRTTTRVELIRGYTGTDLIAKDILSVTINAVIGTRPEPRLSTVFANTWRKPEVPVGNKRSLIRTEIFQQPPPLPLPLTT